MRIHPLLCAAVFVLTACDRGSAANDAITMSDSSGVAIVMNDLERLDASCSLGATPAMSIGVEDGGEEYMLDEVAGATRLSDGRVVLANRSTWQLRYYDPSGAYIRSTGRQGEGPGEFRQPFYLHRLPGDTVYAGDYRPFRFLVFGPDGQWVRTVDPAPQMLNTPRSMNVMDDGRMVLGMQDVSARFAGDGEAFPLEKITLQLHDASGALLDTLATLPNGRYGEVVPGSRFFVFPFFESFAMVAAKGDRLVMGHGSETELRVHGNGEGFPLERIVRWTGKSRAITSADVAAAKAWEESQLANSSHQTREMMLPTLISDKRIVADQFPAMSSLRVGRDGRLWIREYQPPSDTTVRRWVAFARDGRFDCRLQAPRFADYLEFGSDYLLALDTDSLGVERVKQFTLSRVP